MFFSRNKSDKKDKLSHQSLNIMSSSIVSHNHFLSRRFFSYKYRFALTFVKRRGGEGQNGRLKCPLGFLVVQKSNNAKKATKVAVNIF